MIRFSVPVYYELTRDKTVLVGLNFDRSKAHFHTKNKIKKYYHQLVADKLKEFEPITGKYRLHYTYYYKNVSTDVSNVTAMIEKYVLDGLQVCGIISNDSVKHHIGSCTDVGGQDKDNPRVEITIRGVE